MGETLADRGVSERDPWRRRMRRTAERLRCLDRERFHSQIERIEDCLRADAEWNLASALKTYDRCSDLTPGGVRASSRV